MKKLIMLATAMLMTGCGMFSSVVPNFGPQAVMAQGKPVVQPNFAGQRVDVHSQMKAMGSLSARTCKGVGFRGFEIGYMHKMHPKANRFLVQKEGLVLITKNCMGMSLGQVFADLDQDGRYDELSYSAATAQTTVWVPSDEPGSQMNVIGLSCDNLNRCRVVWKKRETRGHQTIQKTDQYTGTYDSY